MKEFFGQHYLYSPDLNILIVGGLGWANIGVDAHLGRQNKVLVKKSEYLNPMAAVDGGEGLGRLAGVVRAHLWPPVHVHVVEAGLDTVLQLLQNLWRHYFSLDGELECAEACPGQSFDQMPVCPCSYAQCEHSVVSIVLSRHSYTFLA